MIDQTPVSIPRMLAGPLLSGRNHENRCPACMITTGRFR